MSIPSLVRRLVSRGGASPRHESEAAFRSMVELSGDVICHVVDGLFTFVSPSATDIFGLDPEAMLGTNGVDLIYGPDRGVLLDVLARTTAGEVGLVRHQLRVICGDGSLKWAETTGRTERGAGGRTLTALVIRDVSERKRAEEVLQELARKDGLTGLFNRRSFDEMLERSWRQTLRQGGEMALLLLDIDNFKTFNDCYGHQAGDDCLRAVASTLGQFARRPQDLACRYGGEEFAIILGDADPDAAMRVGEEVRAAVAALGIPHETSPWGKLTISLGVATAVARVGGSIRMPESLLQAADHALYKAKAAGRNRVERLVLIAPSDPG